jgi:hypothetical protein
MSTPENAQREKIWRERKIAEDQRRENLPEEKDLQDFILEPDEYDEYLKKTKYICQDLEIKRFGTYHAVGTINGKRLVVRTRQFTDKVSDYRLCKILTEIGRESRYSGEMIFAQIQKIVANEPTLSFIFDLVYYSTRGRDYWSIIKHTSIAQPSDLIIRMEPSKSLRYNADFDGKDNE